MAAVLTVPTFGSSQEKAEQAAGKDTFSFPLRLRKAVLEANNHNQADSLEVSVDWRDAGVDPRFIKNATIQFWLGNADEFGVFEPTDKNLRFIGICTKVSRVMKSGSGWTVDMTFHDYTTIFIKAKPFPTAGIPAFTDTLDVAWQKICDHTGFYSDTEGRVISLVSQLRDRIEFRGSFDEGDNRDNERGRPPPISKSCAPRLAKLGKIPTKPDDDAWAVWQRCVGSLGLISYIELDKVIVINSTDYYTEDDPPVLMLGRNVVEAEESVNNDVSDKGVAITSYDPTTGTTIEAYWPPADDSRVKKKTVGAKSKKQKADAFDGSKYDFYEFWGVTDPDALQEIARRAYNERSRQELEGNVKTVEMFVDTVSKRSFDLMHLGSGESIKVLVDLENRELLTSMKSENERIAYLEARGYSYSVARLIARNVDSFARLESTFHTKTVKTSLEFTPEGGSFEIEIHFHNRIQVTGDTIKSA